MEVQGNCVPQARDQHTELALVQVDAPDLVAVREDDEGLKWVCRREEREEKRGGSEMNDNKRVREKTD